MINSYPRFDNLLSFYDVPFQAVPTGASSFYYKANPYYIEKRFPHVSGTQKLKLAALMEIDSQLDDARWRRLGSTHTSILEDEQKRLELQLEDILKPNYD